jgi:hypothetical protein
MSRRLLARVAYTIPNIPSGTYRVVVTVPGFQTFTAQNISVTNRVVAVGGQEVVAGPQSAIDLLPVRVPAH